MFGPVLAWNPVSAMPHGQGRQQIASRGSLPNRIQEQHGRLTGREIKWEAEDAKKLKRGSN